MFRNMIFYKCKEISLSGVSNRKLLRYDETFKHILIVLWTYV